MGLSLRNIAAKCSSVEVGIRGGLNDHALQLLEGVNVNTLKLWHLKEKVELRKLRNI